MSLYQLHSNPQSLYGYGEAPYKIPSMAYELAAKKYRTTRQRDPELERVIAQDPKVAYEYAHEVIEKRWPEAEPVIAQDPEWAHEYAIFVLKKRFRQYGAELVIFQSPRWWEIYKDHFNIKYDPLV